MVSVAWAGGLAWFKCFGAHPVWHPEVLVTGEEQLETGEAGDVPANLGARARAVRETAGISQWLVTDFSPSSKVASVARKKEGKTKWVRVVGRGPVLGPDQCYLRLFLFLDLGQVVGAHTRDTLC